ncbi:lipoxygenase 6, chloroplastic [Senna tora]|uniref:Lipoxygenase 6, chloroplastic n=1 Tax=Senna tora TaxID=362788 RepID=A0A835CF17_9FABA|nr:lipoxygenase 6, chloroplastic [Senna tora]
MFAVNPTNSLIKSNLSDDDVVFRRSPPIFPGAFSRRRRKICFPATGSRFNRNAKIQAVISSSGDKTVETTVESEKTNGSLLSSSGSEGIEVRAVVTIRKKMKEKITEKLEEQWEYFVNGFGQGIQIQLISEEIDPG